MLSLTARGTPARGSRSPAPTRRSTASASRRVAAWSVERKAPKAFCAFSTRTRDSSATARAVTRPEPTASARAMNDPSRSVAGESSVTASIPRDDARNHEVPVREFGRVRLDDRDGKARIHGVRAQGHRAGDLLALEEFVRDFPERFEMVDDSRELLGHCAPLGVGQLERRERGHLRDERGVDLHRESIATRLTPAGHARTVSSQSREREALPRLSPRRRGAGCHSESAREGGHRGSRGALARGSRHAPARRPAGRPPHRPPRHRGRRGEAPVAPSPGGRAPLGFRPQRGWSPAPSARARDDRPQSVEPCHGGARRRLGRLGPDDPRRGHFDADARRDGGTGQLVDAHAPRPPEGELARRARERARQGPRRDRASARDARSKRAGSRDHARALLDGGRPRASDPSRDRAELPRGRPHQSRRRSPRAADAAPEDGFGRALASRAAHRRRARRGGHRTRAGHAPPHRHGPGRSRPRPFGSALGSSVQTRTPASGGRAEGTAPRQRGPREDRAPPHESRRPLPEIDAPLGRACPPRRVAGGRPHRDPDRGQGTDDFLRAGRPSLRRRRVGAQRRRVRTLRRPAPRGRDEGRPHRVPRTGRLEREVRHVAARVREERGCSLKTTGPLKTKAGIRRAFGVLMRRPDARAAASVARPADQVRIVGGAVRDAYLGGKGGDLDLVAPPGRAEPLAWALARHAGTRVIAVGAAPKRILKVPFCAHEIDVWEETGDPSADLLRRDFTVNALSFSLPDGAFTCVPGALADLAARRLTPPRPGVLLEDPLRVLRAARFLAELPSFRVAPSALPEMKRAGRFLRKVAAERRLVEWNKLLGAPAIGRLRALRFLERIGALQSLLRSTVPRTRRGIALVSRLGSTDPRVARALLLLPLGNRKAEEILREWKTSREEQRLASRLFALPPRGPRRAPTRRDVAEFLRRSSPFEEESTAFLRAAGDRYARDLAVAVERILRRPAALRRILKPTRPLPFAEISSLLGLQEGPDLGRALDAFDLALASSEIRGPRAARAWLRRPRPLPGARQPLLK